VYDSNVVTLFFQMQGAEEQMSPGGRQNRLLVTGCRGQVGHELIRALSPLGTVTAIDLEELDLTDGDALEAMVHELAPDAIVNAAAFTDVDRAEQEPEAARALNVTAPTLLAKEAARCGAAMVHYSTDYVFNGQGEAAWTEEMTTDPLSVYGRTKLEGEQAVREAASDAIVLRCSWIYGGRGRNFLRTTLDLMAERRELKVVADQVGAPTWSRTVAQATATVLEVCRRPGEAAGFHMAGRGGTYHLASSGEASWHRFASAILEHATALGVLPAERAGQVVLTPIRTSEWSTPATRPLNSRLNCEKVMTTFGVTLPDWEDALKSCLQEMQESDGDPAASA
jgi:dTDP-4-dehydrorhamnose reductase